MAEAQLSSAAGNRNDGKAEEKLRQEKASQEVLKVAVAPSGEAAIDAGRHDAREDDAISEAPDNNQFLSGSSPVRHSWQWSRFLTHATGEPSGSLVQFAIDKSIASIEYRFPNDIIEMYQSLNRTRLDGR